MGNDAAHDSGLDEKVCTESESEDARAPRLEQLMVFHKLGDDVASYCEAKEEEIIDLRDEYRELETRVRRCSYRTHLRQVRGLPDTQWEYFRVLFDLYQDKMEMHGPDDSLGVSLEEIGNSFDPPKSRTVVLRYVRGYKRGSSQIRRLVEIVPSTRKATGRGREKLYRPNMALRLLGQFLLFQARVAASVRDGYAELLALHLEKYYLLPRLVRERRTSIDFFQTSHEREDLLSRLREAMTCDEEGLPRRLRREFRAAMEDLYRVGKWGQRKIFPSIAENEKEILRMIQLGRVPLETLLIHYNKSARLWTDLVNWLDEPRVLLMKKIRLADDAFKEILEERVYRAPKTVLLGVKALYFELSQSLFERRLGSLSINRDVATLKYSVKEECRKRRISKRTKNERMRRIEDAWEKHLKTELRLKRLV